jgi:hypothetical protein
VVSFFSSHKSISIKGLQQNGKGGMGIAIQSTHIHLNYLQRGVVFSLILPSFTLLGILNPLKGVSGGRKPKNDAFVQ